MHSRREPRLGRTKHQMSQKNDLDFEDWLNRWDMQSAPDFDDKVRECEFFFGLLAEETLFIDDTLKNIEAAQQLGLQTIHLKHPLTLLDLDL